MTLLQESASAVPLRTIAELTGLPKGSVYRFLWTLEAHRYIEDVGGGRYRLGPALIGMQSRHLEILRNAARPWLQKLCDTLGETVKLGILDGQNVIYLDVAAPPRQLRLVATCGGRATLHATAIGKAIAAQMSDCDVRESLAQTGMPPRTSNTITTVEAYIDEVKKVRTLGYAVDNGESAADARCVAVPFPRSRLRAAALSIGAPATRLSMHQAGAVAAHLRDAVEHIAGVLQDRAGTNEVQIRPRGRPVSARQQPDRTRPPGRRQPANAREIARAKCKLPDRHRKLDANQIAPDDPVVEDSMR